MKELMNKIKARNEERRNRYIDDAMNEFATSKEFEKEREMVRDFNNAMFCIRLASLMAREA